MPGGTTVNMRPVHKLFYLDMKYTKIKQTPLLFCGV